MRTHATLPRLYVKQELKSDMRFELSKPQSHFLHSVLRLRIGDEVRVFEDVCGEYLCRVAEQTKSVTALEAIKLLRPPYIGPDIWLLFAPVKRERNRFIVEKATELGVRHIQPVITARTTSKIRSDKMNAHAIEAAEQTERLDIPTLAEPVKLTALLDGWDRRRRLIFADEAGGAQLATRALAKIAAPCAVLIGPEGGFSPAERTYLRAQNFVTPISLGPRILRADTAAISVLSLWQALSGDWQ